MEDLSKEIEILREKKFIKRNYGIDLLRIFSMINIIILHINSCSSLVKLRFDNIKFKPIWRLETLSFCAVNCYGLISGIVGYKKYNFVNLIYIWFNASFYSFVFSLYLYFIKRIILKNLILSLFPILIINHWYINAYFTLYLFVPFLNYGINNLNQQNYKNIIIFYILFFSFYYIIGFILNNRNNNFHFLNNGYSSQWLIVLYIIGGYLGKYIIINKNNTNIKYFIIFFLTYLFSSLLSSESFFYLIEIKSQIFNKQLLINYLSPTIILQALSLIMIFSKLSINNRFIIKIISFFTPLTLNVTLIHWRLFSEKLINLNWMIKINKNIICIAIYLLAIFFYIFFGLIDYLRFILFRILKIKKLCIIIERTFSKIIEKFLYFI